MVKGQNNPRIDLIRDGSPTSSLFPATWPTCRRW